MWANVYVAEKLRELDEERLARVARVRPQEPKSRPILGSVALVTGRTLQRVGEGIESWAGASNERDQPTCC